MCQKRLIKIILSILCISFIGMNVLTYFHARSFTTFSNTPEAALNIDTLSFFEKAKYALFGIDNPRPTRLLYPERAYKTIHINSNERLECWLMDVPDSKGTILMFHGYKGNKSQLLEPAEVFNLAGYNTMLVDMMGAGGSTGNTVTIGYQEAGNVKDCYNYLNKNGEENIILYGISMGAAASMKAIKDFNLQPSGLITEAPFATIYDAVAHRFDDAGVPRFPMAQLLLFWGGLQNGFWAFSHNPADYAKHITCPVLLLYGAKDGRVSMSETQTIKNNLAGKSKLIVYHNAGHVNYLQDYKAEWQKDVISFVADNLK